MSEDRFIEIMQNIVQLLIKIDKSCSQIIDEKSREIIIDIAYKTAAILEQTKLNQANKILQALKMLKDVSISPFTKQYSKPVIQKVSELNTLLAKK